MATQPYRELLAIIQLGIHRLDWWAQLKLWAVSLLAAIVCAWVSYHWVRLFHRSYKGGWGTKAFSLLSGLGALLIVVSFVGLSELRPVLTQIVNRWEHRLVSDPKFEAQNFARAYERIRAIGDQDFSRFPSPARGGRLVPLNTQAARQEWAQTFADAACRDFNSTHPVIARMIWVEPKAPREIVASDVERFFRQYPGNSYPSSGAIRLVSWHIRRLLLQNVPVVVTQVKLWMLVICAALQAFAFGFVGMAAHRDLRVQASPHDPVGTFPTI